MRIGSIVPHQLFFQYTLFQSSTPFYSAGCSAAQASPSQGKNMLALLAILGREGEARTSDQKLQYFKLIVTLKVKEKMIGGISLRQLQSSD